MDIALFVREHAQAEKGYGDELGVIFKVKDPGHPIWVDGDKDRLAQVMGNLLSNAAKCSRRGGTVEISTEQSCTGKVRVSVSDSGPGIPESKRAVIFNNFAQIDSLGQKQTSGTGLGLAIAKLVVEEHGGTIDLTSEVGKGTTFYFELDKCQGKLNNNKPS